jgi:hypothetical protein
MAIPGRKCKTCTEWVEWRQVDGKWILFNKEGNPQGRHECANWKSRPGPHRGGKTGKTEAIALLAKILAAIQENNELLKKAISSS